MLLSRLSRLSKTKKEEVTCRSKALSEVSRRQHQSSEEEAKKKSFLSKTLIPKLVSQSDLQMPLSIPWREGLEEVSQWFWILRPQTLFFKERRSTVHTQTLVVMLVELHVLLLTALYWGSGGRTTTTKSSSTWKNISSHREREDRGDNSFRFFLLYFFLRSESTEKNLSRRRRLLSWKSWTTISTWRWWQRQAACSDVTSHSRCQRGIVLRQLKEGSRGEERSLVGEEVKGATCTDSCSLQEKNIPCSPCSLSYTV